MKTLSRTRTFLVLLAPVIIAAGAYGVIRFVAGNSSSAASPGVVASAATSSTQRHYSAAELARYDGTDPALPLLIAMNGLVYDVSIGRGYYEPGGTYHFLVGKDSSTELNLIGGDIIRRKYPVVGTFVR